MSVANKIILIMAEVGMLTKDKKLKDGAGYLYLSEEKVTAELHVACVKHKLAIVPVGMEIVGTREDTTQKGSIMHNARIKASYLLLDPDDDDKQEVQVLGEGSDMGDKVLFKCMTSSLKYMLRQTFMISTGEDPDHQASTESVARTQTRPAAAPAPRSAPRTSAEGGGATMRDWFKAMGDAGLLEPDPKPDRPDNQKPTGVWYGISDGAGLPRSWSKYSPAEYALAIKAIHEHEERHNGDDGPPEDLTDPFSDS